LGARESGASRRAAHFLGHVTGCPGEVRLCAASFEATESQ
jgi:hypothetical protein